MTNKSEARSPRLFVRMPDELKYEFDAACRMLSEDVESWASAIILKLLAAFAQSAKIRYCTFSGRELPKVTMSDVVTIVAETLRDIAKAQDPEKFARHLQKVRQQKSEIQPATTAKTPRKVIHASELPPDYEDFIDVTQEIPSLFR